MPHPVYDPYPTHPRGYYLVLEGINGCGKSTMVTRLNNWLSANFGSLEHINIKEPDKNGYWGQKIYKDLADKSGNAVHDTDGIEFQRWFAMNFAENMNSTTVPALDDGLIVIKERTHPCSSVFSSDTIMDVKNFVSRAHVMAGKDFIWPDKMVIFDCSPATAIERMREKMRSKGEQMHGFEQETPLANARRMYREYSKFYPNCVVIDSEGGSDEVFAQLRDIVALDIAEKLQK